MSFTEEDLAEVERVHTNRGEPCELCKHQFPYDSCVSCGEDWPCSAVLLAAEVREMRRVERMKHQSAAR